jgi:hypothetical protein
MTWMWLKRTSDLDANALSRLCQHVTYGATHEHTSKEHDARRSLSWSEFVQFRIPYRCPYQRTQHVSLFPCVEVCVQDEKAQDKKQPREQQGPAFIRRLTHVAHPVTPCTRAQMLKSFPPCTALALARRVRSGKLTIG